MFDGCSENPNLGGFRDYLNIHVKDLLDIFLYGAVFMRHLKTYKICASVFVVFKMGVIYGHIQEVAE